MVVGGPWRDRPTPVAAATTKMECARPGLLQAALAPLRGDACVASDFPAAFAHVLAALDDAIRGGADVNAGWTASNPRKSSYKTCAMSELMDAAWSLWEAPTANKRVVVEGRAFLLAAFRKLLDAGMQMQLQHEDDGGVGWLCKAVWADDVALACALVDAGANVNGDDDGDPPLWLVRSAGMVDALVARGADASAVDAISNATAIMTALEYGSPPAVVAALVAHGAPVDFVDCRGTTALHHAASRAVARPLLEAGARVDAAIVRYWLEDDGDHGFDNAWNRDEVAAALGDEAWVRRRHVVAGRAAAEAGGG